MEGQENNGRPPQVIKQMDIFDGQYHDIYDLYNNTVKAGRVSDGNFA